MQFKKYGLIVLIVGSLLLAAGLPVIPVLISTFTYGGVGGIGPNFADATLQSWLERSIAALN